MSSPLNFKRAEYWTSAPSLAQCPAETGSEVAFAGRSNAGKSSAINTLTHNSKLARTSKTPGRTQMINFFTLGNTQQRLVDLPGYGYAKVPLATKQQWQTHLADYLYQRKSLKGLVLLMDIRHPLQEYDQLMLNWAQKAQMPVHLLLTKSDKLNRGAAKTTLLKVRTQLKNSGLGANITSQTFSSLNKEGITELEQVLSHWLIDSHQQSAPSDPETSASSL